jgi:glutamyl-tRNA synthetase
LEKIFSIENVHKAGAIFNLEKLDWFNWRWKKENFEKETKDLTKMERAEKLLKMCGDTIPKDFTKDKEKLLKALLTVEEKILKNFNETKENISFYFSLPEYNKELLTHEKMRVDFSQAKKSLEASQKTLETLEDWTDEKIKEELLKTVEKLGVKNGQVFWPLRVALSGLMYSPGVFETAWVIGKDETLKRIEKALKKL